MSKNPLQVCRVQVDMFRRERLQTLDLGFGARRVRYGRGIEPHIEVRDEHLEIPLHGHVGYVLGALKLSDRKGDQTRFVTIGEDESLAIWNMRGEPQGQLPLSAGPIGCVWELSDERLVCWSESKTVCIWDMRKRSAIILDAEVRVPENVSVSPCGKYLCLSQFWRALVFTTRGRRLAAFHWHFRRVTDLRRLDSKRWITAAERATSMWPADGGSARALPESFSLDDGYFELPDGELIVVDNDHCVHAFDPYGVSLASRPADAEVAKALRAFIRTRATADKLMAAKDDCSAFEHRRNPISEPTFPAAELAKRGLAEVPDPSRVLWDFFIRPDFGRIRTWLRLPLQAALDARDRVVDAMFEHRARSRRAKFFVALELAACLAAVAIGCGWLTDFTFRLAVALAGTAFLILAALHIAELFTIGSALRALAKLPDELDRFVAEIKARRAQILSELPIASFPEICSGVDALRAIRSIVNGELTELAFEKCGLQSRDLTNLQRKPIVLTDWALGPPGDRDRIGHDAFWWTSHGAFVPAKQLVQFILLSREQIDIFAVEYDFIAQRAGKQTLYTFQTSDFADVTTRVVHRAAPLPGVSARVSATELAFVLASGNRISITALNADSTTALRTAITAKLGNGPETQRRNLLDELELCDPSAHRDIDSLRAQLAALEAESITTVALDPTRGSVDAVVADLKSQILNHKVAPRVRVVSRGAEQSN